MSTLHPRPQYGYVYRLYPLSEQELCQACADYVFTAADVEALAFAANTVELQHIHSLKSSHEFQLAGKKGRYDFGHVFSEQAELRWKRWGQQYDALVLTEHALPQLQHCHLQGVETLQTRYPKDYPRRLESWIVLTTPADEHAPSKRWRLGYIDYVAPNQAVLFVRYTQRDLL
jgi:hypothetical protein